jgi:hypothetical protein
LGGCSLEQNNLPQTGDTFFFLHKDRDITSRTSDARPLMQHEL